jgi:MFS family permease
VQTGQQTGIAAQLRQLFTKKKKHILIIGFGLGVLQQFSGINAILYYAPMVFESAGGGRDAAFLQTMVLGIVFVIMTVVSMFLIDRLGRKRLLYIGVGIMALSLTVTGFVFNQVRYRVNQEQIARTAESVYKTQLWHEATKEKPSLTDFDDFTTAGNKAIFKKHNKIISSLDFTKP